MAATTAVRVYSLMSEAIEFDVKHIFWTDSTTVLRYIQNKYSRFHTFVANRLAIIHDGSSPEQWRYVRSADNPADDVTSGIQSKRWLNGPNFLMEDDSHWPAPPLALQEVTEEDPEVRRARATACTTVSVKESVKHPVERLVLHYSKKRSLLRGLAWIVRFIESLNEGAEEKERATAHPAPICLRGGEWERQIRSVRKIFESLLTSQVVKEETP